MQSALPPCPICGQALKSNSHYAWCDGGTQHNLLEKSREEWNRIVLAAQYDELIEKCVAAIKAVMAEEDLKSSLINKYNEGCKTSLRHAFNAAIAAVNTLKIGTKP